MLTIIPTQQPQDRWSGVPQRRPWSTTTQDLDWDTSVATPTLDLTWTPSADPFEVLIRGNDALSFVDRHTQAAWVYTCDDQVTDGFSDFGDTSPEVTSFRTYFRSFAPEAYCDVLVSTVALWAQQVYGHWVRLDPNVAIASECSHSRSIVNRQMIATFCEALYALEQAGNVRRGIDLIFEQFDQYLRDGRIEFCNELLSSVDITRLQPALMRALLVITYPAKESLSNRQYLAEQIWAALMVQVGPSATAEILCHVI